MFAYGGLVVEIQIPIELLKFKLLLPFQVLPRSNELFPLERQNWRPLSKPQVATT